MSKISGVDKYPHLFSPIMIGNQLYRNRIFASPTGYQNMTNCRLNEGAPAYYGRKAQGGVASVATCEVCVDSKYGSGDDNHLCIDQPHIEVDLGTLANAIGKWGAVPTLELQHAGMYANRSLSFQGKEDHGVAFGPVECELDGRHIQAFTEEMIQELIKQFGQGAALGKKCGFGAVLIHAGHGWGLHQFLSPKTNTRTDKWGGPSIENRTRLLNAIIDEIHKTCGRGFPVEVRMSGSECYDGGYGIEEGIEIAKAIDGHANLIHVSAGVHEVGEVFPVTHPCMFLEDGVNVKYAAEIKKHVKTPVATVGALSDPAMMEEIIASGKADVVELARELMAEPDFVNKVRIGHEEDARRCMRCLSCFSQEMTHGEPYCAINPESGRELEVQSLPTKADVVKSVVIVGGGVGGMQAALTCADMGHKVILLEKAERLGGVLRCEEHVDFKQKLDQYLNLQERLCIQHPNIDVRLGVEATPGMVKGMGCDVCMVAIGAQAAMPPIPGIDLPGVLSGQEAYNKVDEMGDKVVIMGAGLVGVELGLHLRAHNKDVQIVEMLDHISDGGNFLHMPGLMNEVAKRDLKINLSTAAKEITEKGIRCEHNGEEVFFEADTVVVATGQRPLVDKAKAFYACAPEFFMIGDCIAPKNITNATSIAYMTAKNIGRKY